VVRVCNCIYFFQVCLSRHSAYLGPSYVPKREKSLPFNLNIENARIIMLRLDFCLIIIWLVSFKGGCLCSATEGDKVHWFKLLE